MIKEIIQAPDDRLRLVAKPLTDASLVQEVTQDLKDTFAATGGCCGLAATQLGHLWRVIIVDVSPRRTETYLMVNPVIVKMSDDLQLIKDGCMSVAHGKKFAPTKRPKRIIVEWYDEAGDTHKQKFTGLLAACIHHEVDHLDGILFTDRLIAAIAKGEK